MSVSVHTRQDSAERKAAARRQEGSAYVVTLMILLVLSVVGLSLTIVTQTESSIGSQERLIQSVCSGIDKLDHEDSLGLAARFAGRGEP